MKLKGSQFLRQRLLHSTLTATPIIIKDIHAEDASPGLRLYEISLLRLLEKISDDCTVEINEIGTNLRCKPGFSLEESTSCMTADLAGLELKIESREAAPLGGGEVVLGVPILPNNLSAASMLLGEIENGGVVDSSHQQRLVHNVQELKDHLETIYFNSPSCGKTCTQIAAETGLTNVYVAQCFRHQALLKPDTAVAFRAAVPALTGDLISEGSESRDLQANDPMSDVLSKLEKLEIVKSPLLNQGNACMMKHLLQLTTWHQILSQNRLTCNAPRTKKTFKRPDKVLSCPLCKSMDSKFCYYNNYNVNQPMYFCKNCERHWTAGGSMRNVPLYTPSLQGNVAVHKLGSETQLRESKTSVLNTSCAKESNEGFPFTSSIPPRCEEIRHPQAAVCFPR
ncbi:hypothetical protein HPP92_002412 [Vanilla planifolia]|uniref:Dof-type domain-containing protein n=1 Tax=Vanilla planifolia TaxID=51239 RepID=A0A835S163_VANPL|nr:hypothetical protein HPP92_002412 [Vanilla planifolia]